MALSQEKIKILFGLKIKQLRQDLNLTPSILAKKANLSISYLNEIEKGKKYPKSEKILDLAKALDISYGDLVSLKIENRLEAIKLMLETSFIEDIPFDFFGIDPSVLFEMLTESPLHFSTFVNSIARIGKSYNLDLGQFYYAILKSYQEVHLNYFEELEFQATDFLNKFNQKSLNTDNLKDYISLKYGVEIRYFDSHKTKELRDLRSHMDAKKQILSLNRSKSEAQLTFILAREIGFKFLNLKLRPSTYNFVKIKSFEELLNNFKASYFASCILLPAENIIKHLNELINNETFDTNNIKNKIIAYGVSPETYLQRLFTLLAHNFKIKDLAFFKFESVFKSKKAEMKKDLHLGKRHLPQENAKEAYCNRWDAIGHTFNYSTPSDNFTVTEQAIFYELENRKYWTLNIKLDRKNTQSLVLALEINEENLSKLPYLKNIKNFTPVGQSCERCPIFDCKERQVSPSILQKQREIQNFEETIKKYF